MVATLAPSQDVSYIRGVETHLPTGEALRDVLDLKGKQVTRVCEDLRDVLERSRKM